MIVTHVTRMRDERVCIAGVDRDRSVHVRPVLGSGSLTKACLAQNGGVFVVGREVDLGKTSPCGTPPEVEDHHFDLGRVRALRDLTQTELQALLARLAKDDPTEIFGSALHTPDGHPRSLVTSRGAGIASLGVWRSQSKPKLLIYEDKLKLECDCASGPKRFTVTDVCLHQDDLVSIDKQKLSSLRSAIAASSQVLLCVGLSRAWATADIDEPAHWMQVNGIHPIAAAHAVQRDSDELFEQLRRLRKRIADAKGVPAFVVFSDATLRQMAAKRPRTRAQFLELGGVGPAKLDEYGDAFLGAIPRSD